MGDVRRQRIVCVPEEIETRNMKWDVGRRGGSKWRGMEGGCVEGVYVMRRCARRTEALNASFLRLAALGAVFLVNASQELADAEELLGVDRDV